MYRKSPLQKAITIPEYWRLYVNSEVDIATHPSQPCPFHHEEHGRSFSYRVAGDIFSCFGACHVIGGNVVQMHMLNYQIRDYDKAERSLARLLGYNLNKDKKLTFAARDVEVNERFVEYQIAYAKACKLATDLEKWLELDLIMSQYPVKTEQLEMFINKYGGG